MGIGNEGGVQRSGGKKGGKWTENKSVQSFPWDNDHLTFVSLESPAFGQGETGHQGELERKFHSFQKPFRNAIVYILPEHILQGQSLHFCCSRSWACSHPPLRDRSPSGLPRSCFPPGAFPEHASHQHASTGLILFSSKPQLFILLESCYFHVFLLAISSKFLISLSRTFHFFVDLLCLLIFFLSFF